MTKTWAWLIGLVVVFASAFAYVAWQERSVTYLSYNIVNSLEHVSLDEVDEAMVPYLSQSFWDVDMMGLKQRLEQVSWIEEVNVRRNWPGYLEIEIMEHKPIARWGKDSLISDQGEIFTPSQVVGFEDLIQLDGDRLQAPMLLQVLNEFQARLATLGWQVIGLSQQVDGVFRVNLHQGAHLIVDAPNWSDKLARFLKAYPQLSKKLVESAQSYDLRYSNGMAIKVADDPEVQ